MAEVIFLVIVAICIVALFAIEGNRAKELSKLESRIEFLQDRLLELATRADVQDALIKIKANGLRNYSNNSSSTSKNTRNLFNNLDH